MRKIDPASVRSDFDRQLSDLNAFYALGMEKFSVGAERSTFVESCLLVLAVAWEGFVNDIFIAYINRDPSRFKLHLEDALKSHLHLESKPEIIFSEFGVLKIPEHLSKKQIQALTDTKGSNITFSDFSKLEDKARVWLTNIDYERFHNLQQQQKSSIDALIALRNHIAHRSEMSRTSMNAKLHHGPLHNTGLRRGDNGVSNVGAWLKAKPPGSANTRFQIFLSVLRNIGASV